MKKESLSPEVPTKSDNFSIFSADVDINDPNISE